MIKRIPTRLLRTGMYISDMNRDWIPHNNARQSGLIKSDEVVEKIQQLGVSEVYIDTEKGLDCQDAVPASDIDDVNQSQLEEIGNLKPVYRPLVSFAEERVRAEALHGQAKKLVSNLLSDVKLGRALDLDLFDQLADGMLESLNRNQSALSCLGRIRAKDSYLMEHSVNLGVLMSIYGRYRLLGRKVLHDVMVGALLHDIGKIMVPDAILHKPSKLNDDEFKLMQSHVERGTNLLRRTPGISELTIMVQSQHHEKIDGTGYPKGLKGKQISEYGKMAAISDVYDAITSDRVYHRGITPTAAMKKLLEWSEHHLERELVVEFIKCMGIYPAGSLVELESGRLAVVIEVNEHSQHTPVVKLIYNLKSRCHIQPKVVDLSGASVQDRIIKAVDPAKYGISLSHYL